MPTILDREVGHQGFGLMSLTKANAPTPQSQAFDAMNAALETGANLWNGGQFYGTPEYNSLHLLRDYFSKYPENANSIVLGIKGGLDGNKIPRGSAESVRKSVEDALAILPQTLKKMDYFQCARVDPNVPIEDTMRTLKTLMEEGKIGGVGLSEVKAETIRRAHAIVPICAVEVEFSLFETNILENGVASTCAELGIPIVAYSPLGRGLLTGNIQGPADVPEQLRILDKYQGDNLEHNLGLVRAVQDLAREHKDYAMATFALSWIRQLSGKNGLPVFIPISGSSRAENVRANAENVVLSNGDFAKIQKALSENQTKGARGYGVQKKYLEG